MASWKDGALRFLLSLGEGDGEIVAWASDPEVGGATADIERDKTDGCLYSRMP